MADADTNIQLALESLTEYDEKIIKDDLNNADKSHIIQLLKSVNSVLTSEDLPKLRIVLTANFVHSVSIRQSKNSQEYTTQRGSGVVVGKTMPPDANGIVDMLFPLQFLLPQGDDIDVAELESYIQHIGKHEAVHARLHLSGSQPFDVHLRESFGQAMLQFVSMASEQIEEHLAEQLSISDSSRNNWTTAKSVDDALVALEDTLATKLPAIPEDAEDYYSQGMFITFSSFHVLWKALAFLAAELRTGNVFEAIPESITGLESWKHYVEPYWEEHIKLLGEIPISLDVDIQKTDETVKEFAEHLQRWALSLGFDYHDTTNGQAWFQITRPLRSSKQPT